MGLLVPVFLLVAVVASEFEYARRVKPKVTTLNEFLQVMPVTQVRTANGTRGTYTVVRCDKPWWLLAFPDGQPWYRFDAEGKLVNWHDGTRDRQD